MRSGFGLLILISLAMLGCGTSTLNVMNYPGFFERDGQYQSIAVGSVRNNYEPGYYTYDLNRELVSTLRYNNYYYVRDYTDTQQSDDSLVSSLYQTGGADLALFSTLTGYGVYYDSHTETRQESYDVYAVDEDGYYIYDDDGYKVVDHTEYYNVDYTVYDRTAYADIYANVIQVQSGQSLYGKNQHGSCTESHEDPDDFSSDSSAQWCAMKGALAKEVYQVCPTYESITVKNDEVMGIFKQSDQNQWEEEDSFSVNDRIKITLWFPSEALYNSFVMQIVSDETGMVLDSQDVYWQGTKLGIDYSAMDLVNRAGAKGKIWVELWNGDRVAFKKKIKIN